MGICLTRTSVRSSWTRSSDKTVNNNQPGCRVVTKGLQWFKRRHTTKTSTIILNSTTDDKGGVAGLPVDSAAVSDSGSENEFRLVKGKKRTSDSAFRQRSSRASSEAPAKGSPDADNKKQRKRRTTRSSSVVLDVATTSAGASPDDEGERGKVYSPCFFFFFPEACSEIGDLLKREEIQRQSQGQVREKTIPEEEESQPPATVAVFVMCRNGHPPNLSCKIQKHSYTHRHKRRLIKKIIDGITQSIKRNRSQFGEPKNSHENDTTPVQPICLVTQQCQRTQPNLSLAAPISPGSEAEETGTNVEDQPISIDRSSPPSVGSASSSTRSGTSTSFVQRTKRTSSVQQPSAATVLQDYLETRKKQSSSAGKSEDALTKFFLSMAETVGGFPQRDQVDIKSKLFQIVNAVEMRMVSSRTQSALHFVSRQDLSVATPAPFGYSQDPTINTAGTPEDIYQPNYFDLNYHRVYREELEHLDDISNMPEEITIFPPENANGYNTDENSGEDDNFELQSLP
ncbi:hypothetical protein FQR65_LT19459 [Abscondita terminalis]|nr:hypothetical protein FQR65_LT19459 [Abscondita terminalis]